MNTISTYTTCPKCGYNFAIGNYHDCPTHINLNTAAANPSPIVIYHDTNACAPAIPGVIYQVMF